VFTRLKGKRSPGTGQRVVWRRLIGLVDLHEPAQKPRFDCDRSGSGQDEPVRKSCRTTTMKSDEDDEDNEEEADDIKRKIIRTNSTGRGHLFTFAAAATYRDRLFSTNRVVGVRVSRAQLARNQSEQAEIHF
jgi:hypothetical protein